MTGFKDMRDINLAAVMILMPGLSAGRGNTGMFDFMGGLRLSLNGG